MFFFSFIGVGGYTSRVSMHNESQSGFLTCLSWLKVIELRRALGSISLALANKSVLEHYTIGNHSPGQHIVDTKAL